MLPHSDRPGSNGLLNRVPTFLSSDGAHRPEAVGILVACMLILTVIAVVYVLLRLAPVLVPLTFAVFLVACMLILTVIAVVYVLLRLAPVLVPLTFAVFLAFLVEPVLAFIVFTPETLVKLFSRGCRQGATRRGPAGECPAASRTAGQRESLRDDVSEDVGNGLPFVEEDITDDGSGVPLGGVQRASEEVAEIDHCQIFMTRMTMAWDVFSVFLCVVVILALLSSIVLGFYASLNACNWDKYAHSPKLHDLTTLLHKLGVNETSWQEALAHYKGEVTEVATSMIGVIGDGVVTLLLFFFCLVAILPGIREKVPKSRMRTLMQRYLLCKSFTSLVIALAVMFSLWAMSVDLVLVFGMITFLANFIPNIGSFFSILAPAPFVYLTPGKNLQDVALVVIVPFLIHNTLGCILEPQMMQAGLDLHPLTVVVALTFWGSVWGIAGMVLSVPITCVIRLCLEEVDHPHARLIHDMLNHPLGTKQHHRRTQRARTPLSSSSGNSAD